MWVLVILIAPFVVLYEVVKMNEKTHHRSRHRHKKGRKRF